MTINRAVNGTETTIALEGRLDTTTAPQLDTELKQNLGDAETLIFDFEKLDYISSAGLRLLLQAQKLMNKRGSMVIRNVNETVMEVFEVTGFSDVLTIE